MTGGHLKVAATNRGIKFVAMGIHHHEWLYHNGDLSKMDRRRLWLTGIISRTVPSYQNLTGPLA